MKKLMQSNRIAQLALVAAALMLPALAHAGTDVDEIVTGATTTFVAVATLCVTIGVFFVGYRIAKKVR